MSVGAVAILDVQDQRPTVVSIPPDEYTFGGAQWADAESILVQRSVWGAGFMEDEATILRLFVNGRTEEVATGTLGVLSPDGRRLAYPGKRLAIINVGETPPPVEGPIDYDPERAYSPAWSPSGDLIAYLTYVDGWQIRVAAPDGSAGRVLTTGDAYSWSRDGARIAFTRGGNLWLIDTDGTSETQLTGIDIPLVSGVRWSPDGRIFFEYARSWPEIRVAAADGSSVTSLVPGAGPVWSPDGTRIAFVTGSYSIGGVGGNIHTMAPDGSNITRLPAQISHGDVGIPPCINRDYVWSPDSRFIFFCQQGTYAGEGGIFRVAADGNSPPEKIVEAYSFDLSQDGRLVFAVSGPGPDDRAIYVRDAATGADARIADGEWPSWSADVRYISYQRGRSLYVRDMQTSNERLIASTSNLYGNVVFQAWSPVGPVLAYSMNEQVYLMDVSTGEPAAALGEGHYPSWSPDGTRLADYSPVEEGLRVIDVATGESVIVDQGGGASWSPDGSAIAYATYGF